MAGKGQIAVIESDGAIDRNGSIVDVHSLDKTLLMKSLLSKHLQYKPAGQNYRQVY